MTIDGHGDGPLITASGNRRFDVPIDASGEQSESRLEVAITSGDEDPHLGRMFGGYKLESRLGQGGMGTVYKGRQISLDRVVAVKILNKALYENREFIRRFEREAKSIARINHPNIVAVYDFGVHEGLWYMVNEFVEGCSLATVIGERLVVPVSEVVSCMAQCLAGLDHVAQGNIVHRDIKPDNILITRDGIAKIADFGLAKDASDDRDTTDLTAVGLAMGTPAYMSPEQCMGRRLDGRSDIYALGVTAYFALTGEKPFTGQSSFEIMTRQREHVPPLPHQLNPSVPSEVSDLVMRMIAKEPSARFPTAAACREAWLAVGRELGHGSAVRRSGEYDVGLALDPRRTKSRSDPQVPAPPATPNIPSPLPEVRPTAVGGPGGPAANGPGATATAIPIGGGLPPAAMSSSSVLSSPGRGPSAAEQTRQDRPTSERYRPTSAATTCQRCGHLNRPEATLCARCATPLRGLEGVSDQMAEAQRLIDAGRHREAAIIYARLADKETDKRARSVLRAKEREARRAQTERQVADLTARSRTMSARGDIKGAIALLEEGRRLIGGETALAVSASATGVAVPEAQLLSELVQLHRRQERRRRLRTIAIAVVVALSLATAGAVAFHLAGRGTAAAVGGGAAR